MCLQSLDSSIRHDTHSRSSRPNTGARAKAWCLLLCTQKRLPLSLPPTASYVFEYHALTITFCAALKNEALLRALPPPPLLPVPPRTTYSRARHIRYRRFKICIKILNEGRVTNKNATFAHSRPHLRTYLRILGLSEAPRARDTKQGLLEKKAAMIIYKVGNQGNLRHGSLLQGQLDDYTCNSHPRSRLAPPQCLTHPTPSLAPRASHLLSTCSAPTST